MISPPDCPTHGPHPFTTHSYCSPYGEFCLVFVFTVSPKNKQNHVQTSPLQSKPPFVKTQWEVYSIGLNMNRCDKNMMSSQKVTPWLSGPELVTAFSSQLVFHFLYCLHHCSCHFPQICFYIFFFMFLSPTLLLVLIPFKKV